MISIAICSHDRSEDAALCLQAVAPQIAQYADELVIVDSCSSPQHARTLRELASTYRGRLVRLETPGHSIARNAALNESRGEWVAYLDDDAVAFPDWLTSLHKAIGEGGANLAAVGGLSAPGWPDHLAPKRISPRWLFYLSCIQDQTRRSVRQGAKVCGVNLAFHREKLLSLGGFRTELGRIGDRLIGGEETLAARLLLRKGFEVMYEPSVRVTHRIFRERLTIEWIQKRAFWEGVTEVAMVNATGEPFPRKLSRPKLAVSALLFGTLYAATGNPDFMIRSRIAAGALSARFKPLAAPAAPVIAPQANAKASSR